MSARATSYSIPKPHSKPRSGRGRKLTPDEEELLRTICHEHAWQGLALSDHPKSFWIACSEKFTDLAGRPYSWQSCRRRMIAWPDGPPPPSVPVLGAVSSASANTRNKDDCLPSIEVESENDDDDDDDDGLLPDAPVPPLQRYVHADCKAENDALRDDMFSMIMSSVTAVEAQLRRFGPAVIEDERYRELVARTFDNFKDALDVAVMSNKFVGRR